MLRTVRKREDSPGVRRWPGETSQGAKRPSIYMFLEGRLVFDANKPSESRRFTFFGADASHRRVLERVVCSCSTIERRVLRVFTWLVGCVAWESGHGAWLTFYLDVRLLHGEASPTVRSYAMIFSIGLYIYRCSKALGHLTRRFFRGSALTCLTVIVVLEHCQWMQREW